MIMSQGRSAYTAFESCERGGKRISRFGRHSGDHRLFCGSALEASAYDVLLEDVKAAAMFTNSPYNVKIDGHVCGSGAIKHREFAMASGEMTKEEPGNGPPILHATRPARRAAAARRKKTRNEALRLSANPSRSDSRRFILRLSAAAFFYLITGVHWHLLGGLVRTRLYCAPSRRT